MGISITSHAIEKYSKRIKKDVCNILDIDTKERYTKDITKIYENSILIYEGKFFDHSKARFLLADDIILVSDVKETKIITLYRIDFGFDNETNKMLQNKLIENLKIEKQKMEDNKLTIEEEANKIKESLMLLESEKKDIQASLDAVESAISSTAEYHDHLSSEVNRRKNNYNTIARQLCYSINCKKSLEIF